MKVQNDNIEKRIHMDLMSRSIVAMAIYCMIYPAIFYPFDLYAQSPLICWSLTGVSIFISLVRLLHIRLTSTFYDRFVVLWMAIFKVSAVLHAVTLSVLFVVVTYDPEFQVAYTVTLMVCAGITAGGMSSLSPSLFVALIFPSIVLIPTIIINLLSEQTQSTGWVILIYLVYLIMLTIKANKEYMRTFAIEEVLERQKKELETLSRVDALTGLYNRGYFNTLYDMSWDYGMRNNTGLTLMMIDADLFKNVNDTYGHISGDKCLKVIADIVNDSLRRKTDISCRFGGEEFAILISNTPVYETEKIAEKIRKNVEAAWIENAGHRFQVTISIGVANILPSISVKPIRLIEQADKALYKAKKAGRNRVRCLNMN